MLRVLGAVREDEVPVEGEIVVSGYDEFDGGVDFAEHVEGGVVLG